MAASAGVAVTLAVTSIATPSIRHIMQNSEKGLNPRVKPKAGQLPQQPSWQRVGEHGMRVATGDATLARYEALLSQKLPEIEDIIPADGSLLVVLRCGAKASANLLAALAAPLPHTQGVGGRMHEIAVEYGGEAGPDLPKLAERAGMDVTTYINSHSAVAYTVAFLGFQPGFPYLRGLPPDLHAPRLASPRVQVPAGSVAIGGTYTGIYPASGPGGWQIIGRTAAVLFDPQRDAPALLMPGDRVRFVPQ